MSKIKKLAKAAGKVAKKEHKASAKAARKHDHPAVKVTGFLAEVADQPQLIATSVGTIVIGLALRRPQLVRGGSRMLAAHLLATGAKTLVKRSVDRTRPKRALASGHRLKENEGARDHQLNSMPSGHTAGAVAVARAAGRDIDGAAAPAALAAGAVAAAQLPNAKHYLSDVLAGAVIGWLAEAAVSAVFDRIDPSTASSA